MLSNIGLTLEQLKKLPNSEARARLLHAGQTYGNGGNFFDKHTSPVTKDSVNLAKALKKVFQFSDKDIKIIKIVSHYHDSIEDWLITEEELKELEWEVVATMAEKLNKKKSDGTYKPDYYPIIAEDIKLKIIKFCDRRRNTQATIKNNSLKKIIHHLQDYQKDRHNYYKYDIWADAIANALTTLKEWLDLRKESWYMKRHS